MNRRDFLGRLGSYSAVVAGLGLVVGEAAGCSNGDGLKEQTDGMVRPHPDAYAEYSDGYPDYSDYSNYSNYENYCDYNDHYADYMNGGGF